MWPVATDGVVWSVCLSVRTVSPAKAAELIVVPFRNNFLCVRHGKWSLAVQ